MSAFNCRVRRAYRHPRFDPEKIYHSTEYHAIRAGVTILVVAWVAAHVWGDLKSTWVPVLHAGEQKANTATISNVPNRSCRVSITDLDGIEHSAHVTADTLYEAVARGLKAIKESVWAGELPEGLTTVTVCAAQPEVEHHVKVSQFKSWLNRNGGSPADKIARLRIREILGL